VHDGEVHTNEFSLRSDRSNNLTERSS